MLHFSPTLEEFVKPFLQIFKEAANQGFAGCSHTNVWMPGLGRVHMNQYVIFLQNSLVQLSCQHEFAKCKSSLVAYVDFVICIQQIQDAVSIFSDVTV